MHFRVNMLFSRQLSEVRSKRFTLETEQNALRLSPPTACNDRDYRHFPPQKRTNANFHISLTLGAPFGRVFAK
jgi:hypothetical protein